MTSEQKEQIEHLKSAIEEIEKNPDSSSFIFIKGSMRGDDLSGASLLYGSKQVLIAAISKTVEMDKHFQIIMTTGLLNGLPSIKIGQADSNEG